MWRSLVAVLPNICPTYSDGSPNLRLVQADQVKVYRLIQPRRVALNSPSPKMGTIGTKILNMGFWCLVCWEPNLDWLPRQRTTKPINWHWAPKFSDKHEVAVLLGGFYPAPTQTTKLKCTKNTGTNSGGLLPSHLHRRLPKLAKEQLHHCGHH